MRRIRRYGPVVAKSKSQSQERRESAFRLPIESG